MADKWSAIHTFWNSFGLPAYDENTVPESASLPYITYAASVAGLDESVYMTASVWYKSNSWAEISRKTEEISDLIGGGYGVGYDGGRMWVVKGAPFGQRMFEQTDKEIRRIVLQITAEFQ